jgi:hypothetical protein
VRANGSKTAGPVDPAQPHKLGVVKPDGFRPPDHGPVIAAEQRRWELVQAARFRVGQRVLFRSRVDGDVEAVVNYQLVAHDRLVTHLKFKNLDGEEVGLPFDEDFIARDHPELFEALPDDR